MQQALQAINEHFQVTNVRENESSELESLTVLAPDDYAAMDVSVASGDEVAEQKEELLTQLKSMAVGDEAERVKKIEDCDCRFDAFIGAVLRYVPHLIDRCDRWMRNVPDESWAPLCTFAPPIASGSLSNSPDACWLRIATLGILSAPFPFTSRRIIEASY